MTDSVHGDSASESGDEEDELEVREGGFLQLNPKTQRVVDWTVQSLMSTLERLVGSRKASNFICDVDGQPIATSVAETPLEELVAGLSFHRSPGVLQDIANDLALDQNIEDQLELYVGTIASLYPSGNGMFHCFDHAVHVTQTVVQLMSYLCPKGPSGPTDDLDISSDLLCVFACAFAALIHDVDHPGVPNFKLKAENPKLATTYKGRSIAEQHSFTLAWNLLQEERFQDLRQTICPDAAETTRFRQLVITAIIATDLFDAELNESRQNRWKEAFASTGSTCQIQAKVVSAKELADAQATIVLEHLIQVADISHTMQHW